jgi:hypothetical protein
MASRTLSKFLDGVEQLSDQSEFDADSFVTKDEATRYINEGISELWETKVDADNGKLLAVNGIKMEQSGVHAWLLPADFERLVSLSIYDSGRYHPASAADVSEYEELATSTVHARAAKYFIREEFGTGVKELYLFPSGLSADCIGYTYLKSPPQLSLDTDTFLGTLDDLEFIETDAAIKVLSKEESDTSALEYRKQQLKRRIVNSVKDVDLNAPRTVRRMRRRGVEF